jgi:hypothetical protein
METVTSCAENDMVSADLLGDFAIKGWNMPVEVYHVHGNKWKERFDQVSLARRSRASSVKPTSENAAFRRAVFGMFGYVAEMEQLLDAVEAFKDGERKCIIIQVGVRFSGSSLPSDLCLSILLLSLMLAFRDLLEAVKHPF